MVAATQNEHQERKTMIFCCKRLWKLMLGARYLVVAMVLLLPQLGFSQLIGKDRIFLPYARVHRHLGFLLGIWYEDIRWWNLRHRTRAQGGRI